MAFRLLNITNEVALGDGSQSDLEALLSSDQKFTIPRLKNGDINCRKLVEQFRLPEDLPRKLANALYYIDAMATNDGADQLQTEFEKVHPDFTLEEAHVCPIGCSIKAWLKDSALVKRVLAETSVENIQATDVFRGPSGKTRKTVTKNHISKLTTLMRLWFDANRRGKRAEITHFKRNGAIWFVVRRGDAFKREAQINQDTGESVASFGYKELHDIVIYDPEMNDLQVHADGTKVKRQYALAFGEALFGDIDFFQPGDVYTLKPLLKKKSGALNCGGIPGLTGARLFRIEYPVGNSQNETVAHKSDDLLVSFAEREKSLASSGVLWNSIQQLRQATIKLEFTEVDGVQIGERSVRICPPGRVLFKRDGAAPLIERFLKQNGYVLDKPEAEDAEDPA
ncbi:hypothetical protein [Tichowtungia aerotolerans]|uniref:Uncharacterized protein n=1 Tax=Tichowtungia aerotolerans TaxID=2697043 RepID=A0A6P1M4Y0_9BACT|nr:hypothetical protein [Tichowtungia aerotolerans]QHI69849.1 hypothetical protein GT409_10430 [Tichowtungia aerotolerans]